MRSWGAEVSRPIRIGALNIGGQRCWTIRADVRTLAASNWKSGPDTVWLSIIGIYSGVCCVIGQHSACADVLLCSSLCCSFYAIPHRAWERLGDNCREKSNKHFFTDKRIRKKKGNGPNFDTKPRSYTSLKLRPTDWPVAYWCRVWSYYIA